VGALIFLFIAGAVFLVLFIALAIGGLLFGGEDPYEKELQRMGWEDEMLSRMENHKPSQHKHYHLTDARQLHLHVHEHKAGE